MRRRAALGWLAVLPAAAAAQVRRRPQTMTRQVKLFLDLEAALFEAQIGADSAALDRLLADEFEQRGAQQPGKPLPRAEWLADAVVQPPTAVDLEQMAVHDRGDTALVSFIARPRGREPLFLVDLWIKAGDGWKLKVRYASKAR